jgi:hypothetical protein
MSRSGYSDSCEGWALIRWRGQVASAIRGKRGQALLRDMKAALEAMPERRLISGELECKDGVCALGALGKARGVDMTGLDPYWREGVAEAFDVAEQLAAEVMHVNDEQRWKATPEERWSTVHAWVCSNLREESP